jgi:hypothetical protein
MIVKLKMINLNKKKKLNEKQMNKEFLYFFMKLVKYLLFDLRPTLFYMITINY